jgi:cellulose synthase/poly-beta-1,6-N-acetylglucosamine synthase-like glycosyltransferase
MTLSGWDVLKTALQVIYILCSIGLFFIGMNTIVSCVLYLSKRRLVWGQPAIPAPKEWPRVTIQLPIFNEKVVLVRLLKSVTGLDYPANRLQIQVLDDSTDSTSELAQSLVQKYKFAGFNIQYYHRKNRVGYKAGNLRSGLPNASGEFIAIFDADFRPESAWLKQVVPSFQDKKIGFVQTRWSYFNRSQNLVTRMAGLVMDGHFTIEQTARVGSGLMTNFNGSAGIWRKTAIESSGGWQTDTLTEDLDLSLRAQAKGWKAAYLPEVMVASASPAQIEDYKKQQYRWVKGTIQVSRKQFFQIWRSPLAFFPKFLMTFTITFVSLSFILVLLAQLLFLPIGLFAPQVIPIVAVSGVVAVGPGLFFLLAKSEDLPRWTDRLKLIPAMLLLGMGVSVNNTLGAVSGLISMGGVFERTPKDDPEANVSEAPASQSGIKIPLTVWGELAMGFYSLASLIALYPKLGIGVAPYLLFCAAAYFWIGLISLGQILRQAQMASARKRAEQSAETVF